MDQFAQAPNRSRQYLFSLLAQIISNDNKHIPAESVHDGTRPTGNQIAQFEIALKRQSLLAEDERIAPSGCVDEIITPLVR